MKLIEAKRESNAAVIELSGQVRELPARWIETGDPRYDRIEIGGFAVRYSQGSKIWHGTMTYWLASGRFQGPSTPLDHRSTRHSVSVVGFYEDTREAYRSQRPGTN